MHRCRTSVPFFPVDTHMIPLPTLSQISVTIPVYNGAKYLREAILSVLGQSVLPLELVILDNSSTDGTDQVINEFRAHPLVRTMRNARTLPAFGNWQKAVSLTRAPYFTILPADDLLGPDLLATAWKALREDTQVGLFFCLGQNFIDATGARTGEYLCVDPAMRGHVPRQTFLDRIVQGQFFNGQGAVIKRESFDLVGGFDLNFVHHGDFELYLRLGGVGDVFAHPGILTTDRRHAEQGRARCYFDDDGDSERIFNKMASYTFLSEAQQHALVVALCDHYFQLFSRLLNDKHKCLKDIAEKRRSTFGMMVRWRNSGLPWAAWARCSPSRWRAKIAWAMTSTYIGIRLVRFLGRHLNSR
jgi:glycosyltransferase involved in cell wall biosynthesis